MRERHVAILIAEDSEADAERAREILSSIHVLNPTYLVRDGTEAIDYLRGRGAYADRERFPFPGLLLVDLIMPGKSGLEVLRWIREQPEPQFHELGRIAMTGMGNIDEIRQAYQLGARSFLVKPLRRDDVLNLLTCLGAIRLEFGPEGRSNPRPE